jgi:lipopolysaccharide/colanic/teichoic acid biosynthesis glycosyltransferase
MAHRWSTSHARDISILFVGDLMVFAGSLWLALVARHFVAPNAYQFFEHLIPFSILFGLGLIVFMVFGLYDRTIAFFEHKLPNAVLEAQLMNAAIAVVFFFVAPIAIQPKTVLALYFVISTALIVVWRLGVFRVLDNARERIPAVVVGTGADIDALAEVMERASHSTFSCAARVDSAAPSAREALHDALQTTRAQTVLLDPRAHALRTELPQGVECIAADELYEALLSRVPLSMTTAATLAAHAETRESRVYGALKRSLDVAVSIVFGIPSLVIYPFVFCALKFQDGGVLFYKNVRVGRNGVPITVLKFRSMSGTDSGAEALNSKLVVTPFGRIMRKTRIDELPQLWNVLRGDLSLIGPRPELPALVDAYTRALPLYDLRHSVTPGLSGWAQVYHEGHPHHGTNVDATAEKLAYDLYYVKHRSFMLDLMIGLKTVRTLLTLGGR